MKRYVRRLRDLLRRSWHQRQMSSPYRYIIRSWEDLSDLDLAARVCNTEFFRRELVPQPLDLGGIKALAVIAPHQDDEAIGCGGLMLLAHRLGIPIRVLFLTDGLNARIPPIPRPDEYRAMRRLEAASAIGMVDAEMVELGIVNTQPRPTMDHLQDLARFVNAVPGQAICVPWLLDNPAKHRLTHHLLYLAQAAVGLNDAMLIQYQVHNTPIANSFLDITDVVEEKQAMIRCYESQLERAPYDHINLGLTAWNSHYLSDGSPEPRHVELFSLMPLHEDLALVKRFYFADLKRTYRGQSSVLSGIQALHDQVLSAAN